MADSDASQELRVCEVCERVPWHGLPSEDAVAHPHQPSGQALESSARNCPICQLVLRAAISNCRDSYGVRLGKSYWRQWNRLKVQDESGIRDVTVIKDLGVCAPRTGDIIMNKFTDARPIITTVENQYLVTGEPGVSGRTVVMPTGSVDMNRNCVVANLKPEAKEANSRASAASMPVWVYGNWWCHREIREDDLIPRLVGFGARFGVSGRPEDAINTNDPTRIQLRGSSVTLCTDEDSGFDHISGRLPETRSDTDLAFRRLAKWLDDCTCRHPACPPPDGAPLPTRVIDVSIAESSVALLQTSGQQGRYIALTHSWGKSSRLMTKKGTLEQHKAGIPVHALPKTFRDAVTITRRLGVKYLWIDCLCIVQDDPSDWEREAATMGQVYRHSYVTISAASCRDSNDGCFPSREAGHSYISAATRSLGYEAERGKAHLLNVYLTGPPPRPGFIYGVEEWLPGSAARHLMPQYTHIGAFGDVVDPLADEHLSTRAWTLQERLLSPRVIHYGASQMYFECESGVRFEDGSFLPDAIFSMTRLLKTQFVRGQMHGLLPDQGISFYSTPSTFQRSCTRLLGGWLALVEHYSKRCLTMADDKLTALAGVARELANITKDDYYAGVWRTHIYEDLFWRVYAQEEVVDVHGVAHRPRLGKILGSVRRPATWRAPSWSWAPLDAPVRFLPLDYKNLHARVISCSTVPAGQDKFGRVLSGSLEILAPLFEMRLHDPKRPWRKHGTPVNVKVTKEDGPYKFVGSFYSDDFEPLVHPCYALFFDPAKALVIRSKDILMRPGSPPRARESATTEGVRGLPELRKDGCDWGWKSPVEMVRVGVAEFAIGGPPGDEEIEEEDKAPRAWDPEVDGKITLDKVMYRLSDETWGPILGEEPRICVTIV